MLFTFEHINRYCVQLENCPMFPNPVILVHFSCTGANDFIPLSNEVLTIPSTATESAAVCLNITVTGDMIVEENEIFTISVETSNPNDVIMGSTTATVTIVDDDSKYFILTLSKIMLLWFYQIPSRGNVSIMLISFMP